jgi:hypothetical protein
VTRRQITISSTRSYSYPRPHIELVVPYKTYQVRSAASVLPAKF